MPANLHYELLQTNANHSARAQDLLMQVLAEWRIDVAVVAEPYLVPSHPNWVGDTEGSVGVVVPTAGLHRLSLRERGAGYTAANWGEVVIIGVYFSPNRPFREFERFLGALEPVVRRASPSQVVLMGGLQCQMCGLGFPCHRHERGTSAGLGRFGRPSSAEYRTR
ncbi:uncharacterized protein [Choristoneura fumiferana]|uniref:uncharacterized protein n=1 Tax=Choristoneura fumiferana TaxID=7141 RepID=UPI003D158C38